MGNRQEAGGRKGTAQRRVAVDTGGTFTDLIEWTAAGLSVRKVLSTPAAPEEGVLSALAKLSAPAPGDVLVHGNTVGLNAVLEGRGSRLALITNEGFEDLIEIGRQDRKELYAITVPPRPQLVPRERRFGIRERRHADGQLDPSASPSELEALRKKIEDSGADALAICLLHSYAHPEDEERIAEALRPMGLPISLSSRLVKRHREYERFSTAVMNAFIAERLSRYLSRLAKAIEPMKLSLMRNEGGSLPAEELTQEPVRAILSGPAGGVHGAKFWADVAGFDSAVGFDMGGTSADVALCVDETGVIDEAEFGGQALALPTMPILSVGTGGGSIAFLDAGGALRVGPKSAGADPGPACYGKGDEATVTDAHLLLGRLPKDGLLGGDFSLDEERAASSIGRLADSLGIDRESCARGILEIADLQMARPLRAFTLGRGLDPAEVGLVAFGGAGGLHAVRLAEELGFESILVPPEQGILSAVGMLLARPVVEEELAYMRSLEREPDPALAEDARAFLERLIKAARKKHGEASDQMVFAALRYVGNRAEFWVPAEADAAVRFEDEFEARFGFRQELPIEVLRLRARLVFEEDRTEALETAFRESRARAAQPEEPPIPGPYPARRRACLVPLAAIAGPSLVLDYAGTTVIEEGWSAVLEESGALRITREKPAHA